MRFHIAVTALLLSTLLHAQEALQEAPPADMQVALPVSALTIPAKTPVLLEFVSGISSKTALKGGEVQFVLAEDFLIDDRLLIAKGTPAVGEIIHAQKSGFGGRGGELIIAARYIQNGEQRVSLRSLKPLAGPYAGKNHSDAALAVSMVPYAGLVSLFITGGEIVIPAGTKASALTAIETQVTVPSTTP